MPMACSEVLAGIHRGDQSAQSITHRHVIAPANTCVLPSRSLSLLGCFPRVLALFLQTLVHHSLPSALVRAPCMARTHSYHAIHNPVMRLAAKMSCTPLTHATLLRQKANPSSNPDLNLSKHPKAQATAPRQPVCLQLLGLLRPISCVNHEPCQGRTHTMSAERTTKMPALDFGVSRRRRSLTIRSP
jgi:hypothetical protein